MSLCFPNVTKRWMAEGIVFFAIYAQFFMWGKIIIS